MKKYSYIVGILLILTSCDKNAYYDYFVINQCNEEINVRIESDWYNFNSGKNLTILSHENTLIVSFEWINGVKEEMVERFFKEITIHKGDKISKVNYIDKDKWKFDPTSKYHANCYLTVYPEDFEDE